MHPFVLGISGASAQPLAERALQLLLRKGHCVHLVISRGAFKVFQAEQGLTIPVSPVQQENFWRDRLDVSEGNLICHRWDDQSASIASGSFQTRAMQCSLQLPATCICSALQMPHGSTDRQ